MNVFDTESWYQAYPQLAAINDDAWSSCVDEMEYLEIPAGTSVFQVGEDCTHFFIILEGTAKVFAMDKQGHEIVLYRVWPGDLCVVTLATLLQDKKYPANGVTESDIRAARLPLDAFHRIFDRSRGFRSYVLDHLSARLHQTMRQVQEVAFDRLDIRLASLLYRRFLQQNSTWLEITHNQLAMELGTSREVTSRMLKSLERQRYLRLRRGIIKLSDEYSLERLNTLVKSESFSA
jgi:CRP/FNR family transcriptional regulator